MRTTCCIAVIILAGGVSASPAGEMPPREAYRALLDQFTIERPGYGRDSHFKGNSDQSMTYGLVLWAEAIRFGDDPTDEGEARIRAAAKWLYENRDRDGDAHPGWGLPKAYDTWADGSINPAYTPYTITTAICLLGLIEATEQADFWSRKQRDRYEQLIKETTLHWSRSAWSEGYGGGYFWYSPNPNDRIFCVNPSSMMLAAVVKSLSLQSKLYSDTERAFLEARADETLNALVHTVQMRDGAPYWRYAPLPNKFNHDRPNDALHQVYTLWGIELYRDHFDRVMIPWTRDQSIESVDRYTREGKPYLLPQDVPKHRKAARLDRLWGRGMVLAFYARWADQARARNALTQLMTYYGDWPHLVEWPSDPADAAFYPRQAAHVLLGVSIMAFE